jgi:hypothetical protein
MAEDGKRSLCASVVIARFFVDLLFLLLFASIDFDSLLKSSGTMTDG